MQVILNSSPLGDVGSSAAALAGAGVLVAAVVDDACPASDGRAFFEDDFLVVDPAVNPASLPTGFKGLALGVYMRAGGILRVPPLGEAPLALPLPFPMIMWCVI